MKLKIGTVKSKADISRTGIFKVSFGLTENGKDLTEDVRYVSPFGNSKEGFIAIPPVGATVLVAHEPDVAVKGNKFRGYFYLGSIMGTITGRNQQALPTPPNNKAPSTKYVDKTSQGQHGPPLGPNEVAQIKPEQKGWLPERFKDMYQAKGIMPEAMGFTNHRGDAFKIADRSNNTSKSSNPFQDYAIGIMSGSGKRIQAVDSPIVDGIVMTNEHRGKDFFIWSTGLSPESPFAQGEYHMRTHGPVNLYTLYNRFHIWVEDGLNIEIENKSTPSRSYGPGINGGPPAIPPAPPVGGLPNGGLGGYEATRKGVYGNQTTGCIQILSHYNNVSTKALGDDSVIYIEAPGPNSKVIIDTEGTCDIRARGKLTLQSDTEVEINAPIVDINGSDNLELNGGLVTIDGGEQVRINDNADGGGYTA